MKKQKVEKSFIDKLNEMTIGSSTVDNAKRFENREGYKNDETHLNKLKASCEKYNYLTA